MRAALLRLTKEVSQPSQTDGQELGSGRETQIQPYAGDEERQPRKNQKSEPPLESTAFPKVVDANAIEKLPRKRTP